MTQATTVIPLFPLSTVLVPGLVLPLHIFEPRYRTLVETLQARPEDEREFGVIAIREGHEVGPEAVRGLYAVGTTAVLRQVTAFDDGRYDIVSTGTRRFRLHSIDHDQPYLQGHVTWLPEQLGDAAQILGGATLRRFSAYRGMVTGAGIDGDDLPELPDDPTVLSYLVAAAMIIEVPARQLLLELPDTSARLRAELAVLRRETAIMRKLPSLPAVDLIHAVSAPN